MLLDCSLYSEARTHFVIDPTTDIVQTVPQQHIDTYLTLIDQQLRSIPPNALLEELPGAEVQSAPWCVDQHTGHPNEQDSTIFYGVYVFMFAAHERMLRTCLRSGMVAS